MMYKPNRTELTILFERYISECRYTKQLRSQTIKNYKEVFHVFQKLMPEVQSARDLHLHVLNEFFKRLSTRKRIVGRDTVKIGVKPSTVKTYFSKLVTFFKWLEVQGHIEDQNFTSSLTKPAQPVYEDSKALSDGEVSKIIASISLYRTKKIISLLERFGNYSSVIIHRDS